MARQTHTAHKVYLDSCVPVIIGDLLERLRLVYAQVIDKNIDVWRGLDTFENSVGLGQIYCDAADFCVADFFPDPFRCVINSLLRTASDNDRCSFSCQRTGNREPDSGGRSCDQRFLSVQLQIHSVLLFSIRFVGVGAKILRLGYSLRAASKISRLSPVMVFPISSSSPIRASTTF